MTVERWSVNVYPSLICIPLLWIKVLGISIHAWTKEVFNLVAAKCDKLLDIDWFTTVGPSLGVLRMKIQPAAGYKILAEMLLKVGDNFFGQSIQVESGALLPPQIPSPSSDSSTPSMVPDHFPGNGHLSD
ncbi:hypothetical protein AMTR_s00029p00101750 [Amborella trichopoda]|uniref:Uncharacterized protein n=1 Tax=Amborella trichopoda TaxID=13333 RepID=W1PP12_AMBTC|nr:hypothetical protein AMTR_s00029p00101750 [Amborella trichopoda]